jgi:tRNA (cytosine38-C5)-methyltransferase
LDELKYEVNEFLVDPISVGIPNTRMRYYMTAKLRMDDDKLTNVNDFNFIHRELTTFCKIDIKMALKLKDYIDLVNDDKIEFRVDGDNIKKRKNFVFDVVNVDSISSSTFTKGYGGHHFFGSGSMIQTDIKVRQLFI